MKTKFLELIFIICLSSHFTFAQNVGIGTTSPTKKLEVAGDVKVYGLTITTGGSQSDFLIKNNIDGDVGFRRGHAAQAINYIICFDGGSIPDPNNYTPPPYLGEIKLIAGDTAPKGWALCQGQLLAVVQNQLLFSVLGNKYGGDGVITFKLPNLKDAAPVGAGDSWQRGDRSN